VKPPDLSYRPATAADVRAFYGGSVAQTMRALVITLGGEPVGIVGLAHEGPYLKFFSEEKPELASHRRRVAVLRALQEVMRWVRDARQLVLSLSNNADLMRRLGFERIEDDVYVWPTP
jgi:hypothetical protein